MGWEKALGSQFQHGFQSWFQHWFQRQFQKSRLGLGRLLLLGIVIFGLAIALPSCRSLDRLRRKV